MPLLAVGAVLFTTLVLAGIARITDVGAMRHSAAGPAPAKEQLDARVELRFTDGEDGSVTVMDAQDGRPYAVLESGTNGFIRSVMRGLTVERSRRGIGREPPFVLARTAAGVIFLADPALDRRIDLNAFGSTNAGAFNDILVAAQRALPLGQAAALAEHQGEEQ
ncbi:MAG: phosphonate-binding protein [Gammaproteobacteria bacterium]|nr:phosphonate-binding protein [Gammaproteobacteria bacterium]